MKIKILTLAVAVMCMAACTHKNKTTDATADSAACCDTTQIEEVVAEEATDTTAVVEEVTVKKPAAKPAAKKVDEKPAVSVEVNSDGKIGRAHV